MRKIFPLFFGIYSFAISVFILPLYTGGDQAHYIKAYEGIRDLDFFNAFLHFKNSLGSSEPIVFLIYYISSQFLSKDLLISFANGLLGYCAGYLISKSRASPWIYPLFFFNYYLLVLLFAAERLKFGLLFFGFYLIAKKYKNIYATISILSHSQTLILYAGVFLLKFSEKISLTLKKTLTIKNCIVLIIGVTIVYLSVGEHINAKLASYSGTGSAYEQGLPAIVRPLIFILLSLVYCKKNYKQAIYLGLPMLAASYFLGSERIAVFSYAAFIYFSINYRQGLNFGILMTSVYFSYKGIEFIKNIIEYGNGFYGV